MAAHSLLIVADTAVQQDLDGRFSLNDLHRAAGGEDRNKPGHWLQTQQAADLVSELQTGGIPPVSKTEGRTGGTFVARELVYAYAMWISARFHLQVIRAYDALVSGQQLEHDRTAMGITVPHVLAAQRQAQRLLASITGTTNVAAQQLLYGHLVHTQRLLGGTTPTLAALLATADPRQPGLPGMEGGAQ